MKPSSRESEKRAFVLGAGFSRPAGFPLATHLTDEVLDSLRQLVGEDYELFDFADHVRRLHKWLTRSEALPALNIEEFYEYATVYAEQLRMEQHRATVGRDAGETPYTHADDLITMLSYMDEHLLEVLLEHENTADLAAIERFASILRPGDTVVTFNYDRLVERCLTKLGVPWSFGMDDDQPGSIRILKMHGSLDWICFARNERRERKNMRRLFAKKDVNRERDGQAQTERSGEDEYDFELFQIRDDEGLRGWIEQRALIQHDHRWGLAGLGPQKRVSLVPGLGVVWEHARQALYHADQIVVVGFSFSPFDRLAQIEFARVAGGRDENGATAPRVTVIDPALISEGGQIPAWGVGLIQRIEAVFRPVTPVGAFHENFDWGTLA